MPTDEEVFDPETAPAPKKKRIRDRVKARATNKRWYDNHREEALRMSKEYVATHPEVHRKSGRRYNASVKSEVLSHYSPTDFPMCSVRMCGITDIDMLTLDHINNDGAQHRKTGRKGFKIYTLLRKEGYPPGYQTLCMNHNFKKAIEHKKSQWM